MRKGNKIILTISIFLLSIIMVLILYFVASIFVGNFAESIDTKRVELDKSLQLNISYDDNTFGLLNNATNGKIVNSYIDSVYVKYDEDKEVTRTLYIYYEEYAFISDWFYTNYTPMKVVQINYDNSNEMVSDIGTINQMI